MVAFLQLLLQSILLYIFLYGNLKIKKIQFNGIFEKFKIYILELFYYNKYSIIMW